MSSDVEDDWLLELLTSFQPDRCRSNDSSQNNSNSSSSNSSSDSKSSSSIISSNVSDRVLPATKSKPVEITFASPCTAIDEESSFYDDYLHRNCYELVQPSGQKYFPPVPLWKKAVAPNSTMLTVPVPTAVKSPMPSPPLSRASSDDVFIFVCHAQPKKNAS